MEIRMNDKFRVRPNSAFSERNQGGNQEKSSPSMVGTVTYVNPAHGVALLDFGFFRECFSFYGKGGLYAAQRVGSR